MSAVNLRPLRVTYRAVFKGPVGALNPMNLKLNVCMTIELYMARRDVWKARELDTGHKRTIEPVKDCGTLSSAQNRVKELFQEQCQPWQMWGDVSSLFPDVPPDRIKFGLRVIQPEEVEIQGEKVLFKMPEAVKS
jgi:hypothetical protein